MVDTFHRAQVRVRGRGEHINVDGATCVVGTECRLRHLTYDDSNDTGMYLHTDVVFMEEEDAHAAEHRLDYYIRLCNEAYEFIHRKE